MLIFKNGFDSAIKRAEKRMAEKVKEQKEQDNKVLFYNHSDCVKYYDNDMRHNRSYNNF